MNLNEAEQLAIYLMRAWGLRQEGWKFKFDGAKRRFGQCSYRTKTISLSRHLTAVNDRAEVEDTILHEIAHALAPTGEHHGPAWKAMCVRVGARPERCYKDDDVVSAKPNYYGICPSCGETRGTRFRLTWQTLDMVACRPCSEANGGYSSKFVLQWKRTGEMPKPQPAKDKWKDIPSIEDL